MTFFSKIVIAATAFTALTAARPLAIRDVTSVVTETAYTTVEVPVTLWVDENGKPLSTVAQGGNFAASATPVAEHPKIESSASPFAAHSFSAPVVPTTTPAPQAQVVPTTTSAPAVQTQAPAYTPPAVSSPEPVVASPSPVASSSSAAVVAAPTNSASSGQSSQVYTGDITHWDGGLGACGWNVNSDSEMQIAMPVGMMGAQSNGNPYCGKSLTVKNPSTGVTVQATVGDKCMGCTGASIDLTNALFNAVGGGCDGRCSGFEWWFN